MVSLRDDTSMPLEGTFYGIEEPSHTSDKLVFTWVDLKDIENVELYPTNAKELLLSDSGTVEHFVYRE